VTARRDASRRRQEGAVAPEDALIAAKLRLPPRRAGTVQRRHLYPLLDHGVRHALVLVTAPAGSGKTTLLASWAARPATHAVWLALDAGDNDPARFWTGVIAAVRTRYPHVGEQALALLRQPRPYRVQAMVPTLVAELLSLPRDLVLILDDLHVIEDGRILEAFAFLLDHRPPQLHLIAASRVVPALPVARLRAAGELSEMDASTLRFTVDESEALLRGVVGADVPRSVAARLTERTEGWPAGLQLAALALRAQPDATDYAAPFTGGHRYVMDYLAAEVWERLPDDVRQFLLVTSSLERLGAELCAAVTGQPEAQAMLERLEREQLFLLPLDDERRWYRYHALFAEMLRARSRQLPEAALAAFHLRAVTWMEQHGQPEEAIRHALAAGDHERAGRLVAASAMALLARGEWATLRAWLIALPDALRRTRPALALLTGWVLLLADDLPDVVRWLHAAESQLSAATPPEGILPFSSANELRGYIAVARAGVAQVADDGATAIAHCKRALADLPEDNWRLRGVAYGYLGGGHWILGEAAAAASAFEESFTACERGGMQVFGISSLCLLASVRFAQARLEASAAACERILAISALAGRGFAQQMLARIRLERHQMDAALRHVEQAVECAAAEDLPGERALRTMALARVRAALGDRAGAREALDRADSLLSGSALPSFFAQTRAVYGAMIALLAGELDAAGQWARGSGMRPDDTIPANREDDYLLFARVLVAQGRAAEVLGLLERVRAAAAAQGRTFNVIAPLALRALAHQALGRMDEALADLSLGLRYGEPEGFVHAFAIYGAPMAALLTELRSADTTPTCARPARAYLDTVLVSCAPLARGATPPGLEPLSERELDVLRLIAAGHANAAIAGELVVALSTVKTHLHHIYAKLGVRSRTQALARAREQRLLPWDGAPRRDVRADQPFDG
jgi:LuxR family maltose regulon positive regulatory protein